MMPDWNHWYTTRATLSALAMGYAIAFPIDYAWSQIQSDNTLGTQRSIVTSPNQVNFQIDGGATRGTNLFHSFQEFSVPTGGSVHFNNTANIQNIMTRVTGKSISNIDGLIRANGTANLFLINPNGIIFGRNASLNIGGSFLASTANSLKFADGTEFNATASQTTPLLTVSVPIGLQFGTNSASIVNQSQAVNNSGETVGLAVQPGKSLAIVGGELTISGGILTATQGRIELGSVADFSLVNLNPTENGWNLGYENVQNFQNIQLSQRAIVDASGEGGGNIQIQGKSITITDGSQVAAKTIGTQPGGTVTVTASEFIKISGESTNPQDYSRLTTRTEGVGDAGTLIINTGKLMINAGAQVSSGTLSASKGNGGNLTINASDSVSVSGASADGEVISRLTTRTEGAGNAGNLIINTKNLIVEAGGQISTGTFPSTKGDGGNFIINASDSVKVSGASLNGKVLSRLTTRTEGFGNAGNLTINTGKLIVEAGGQISTGTLRSSNGYGGALTVNASDSVTVSGASPVAVSDGEHLSRLTTRTQGDGKAGNLTITTGKLAIDKGAQVSSGTSGSSTKGSGGTLTVTTSDSVQVSGTSPDGEDVSRLTARTEGSGDAGDLTITTRKLVIENGAQVSAGTFGEGEGGTLSVTASDSVQINGFAIDPDGNKIVSRLATRTQGAGDARALTITTGSLTIANAGQVDVRSLSSGKAGNLEITAGSIQLNNQGKLFAETLSGDGGNIILQDLDLLLLRRNSQISTTAGTAQAGGNGGNIIINTDFVVAVPSENSDIRANAYTGQGGKVDITAYSIFGLQLRQEPTQLSDITASSEFGVQGTIALNTPDVDPNRGLVNLPTEVIDASNQLAQSCRPSGVASSEQSSFVVIGRGGLPPNPKEALSSDDVFVNWISLNSGENNRSTRSIPNQANNTTSIPLVEAQGWVLNDLKQVVLTANAPTVTPHSLWKIPNTCITP